MKGAASNMQQLQPTPETIPMQTDMSARELVDQIKTRMDSLNQQSKDLRKDMILAYTLRVWNELEYGNAESLFRAEFNSSLTAWWRQINTAIFEMVVVGGLPHELVAVIRDVANEIPSEHIGTIRRAIESVGVVSERGARELLEGGAKVSPEQWLYAYELTNGRLTSGTGQQAAQQIQIEQRTEQIARVYPKMAAMIQDGLPMEVAESVINIAAETDDERIHYILQVHGVSDPVVIPHLIRLAKRGKHGSGRESETLSTIVMTGAVSGDDDMPIGAISAVDLETHLQQASREHYFTAIEKSRDAFKTLKHNLIQKGDHNLGKPRFRWPATLDIQPHEIKGFIRKHKHLLPPKRPFGKILRRSLKPWTT